MRLSAASMAMTEILELHLLPKDCLELKNRFGTNPLHSKSAAAVADSAGALPLLDWLAETEDDEVKGHVESIKRHLRGDAAEVEAASAAKTKSQEEAHFNAKAEAPWLPLVRDLMH